MSKTNGKYYNEFPAVALRSLYEDPGFRMQDVADALGVSRQSIGYYMDGTNQPTIENLLKLSDYFNVSVEYMVGRDSSRFREIELRDISDFTGLTDEALSIIFGLRISSYDFAEEKAKENRSEKKHMITPDSDEMNGTFINILDRIIRDPAFTQFLSIMAIGCTTYDIARGVKKIEDAMIANGQSESKESKPLEYYTEPIINKDGTIDASGTRTCLALKQKSKELINDIVERVITSEDINGKHKTD